MALHLYDPLAPDFYDSADARVERDRTFNICSDCRVCVKLCPSFKSLFQMIDELGGTEHVDELTPAQHKRVVDECYQCKLCHVICPYTPDQQQEWRIDFPQLMQRSLAIQSREGATSQSARLLAHTDLQGQVATALAPIVNASTRIAPARFLMEKATGIARDRLLPTFTKVRFSKWFRSRPAADRKGGRRGTVVLFPSCLVEYQQPAIGRSMVRVFEHNGFACELPSGQVCCGMPWLDAGDTDKFREHAQKNVDALLPAVEAGMKVVVPQPTCAYTMKDEVPAFVGTDAARKVAENTFEASEFLMNEHRKEKLDTTFEGQTYEKITWHAACHYRAQQIGPKSSQLMQLTGARVQMVERCAAIDGTWGLRAENVALAKKVAKPLIERVRESDAELIAGDCQLANVAIEEDAAKRPIHPLQVMARAYGLDDN